MAVDLLRIYPQSWHFFMVLALQTVNQKLNAKKNKPALWDSLVNGIYTKGPKLKLDAFS